MKDCSPSMVPIVKGDRFNLDQCPKKDLEREQVKNIPYASTVGSLIRTDNLEVIGYSDSDYVGCIDSQKSTLRYVFMLVGEAISWRSAKQTLIATSTIEVEFVSHFEATSHAAVFMIKNNKSSSRNKHIDIKCLAIRERVKEKTVVIEHVSIELMIDDPLTKGMPPLKFKDHVDRLGLGSFV
ncbi:Retrovirus-related Pol polyprotein from transposon TNT 1-94 [Vitis vinifera]|uniref:Retrovirus-related Pol polyprotein from transposon TNT 1-94 n=1 Tax=Vitis vinifera TaxID=29760 RepID=A0A438HGV7_VITVI|nr:Retrovirus-related Pol polyprotein from transposon TNT 1-94 [Vitis vinifera]